MPCGQCVKSKKPDDCVYCASVGEWRAAANAEGWESPGPANEPNRASIQSGLHVFDSKNRVTKPSRQRDDVQDLRGRVKALENVLGRQGGSIRTPETLGDSSSDPGTRLEAGVGEGIDSLPEHCFRGTNGRTRYVGRSNYALSMSVVSSSTQRLVLYGGMVDSLVQFKDVGAFLSGHPRAKAQAAEGTNMNRLKVQVWSRERQDHQRAYREHAFKLDEMVPERGVVDRLLDLYFSSFETTYRILHLPTFMQQYEDYWVQPQNTDMAFLAKLLASMAIGSCFFTPATKLNGTESLHQAAARWIMAVQSWVTSVFVGSNINFDILQVQCLLMIARQTDSTDGDAVWITAGPLTRSAMMMGLHRDPQRFPHISKFWAEMRRRLWATIVELDLQSSVDGGMPPSIDLDECDCDAPSNCNDLDLKEDMVDDPVPNESGFATRADFQAMFSRSLPTRMRITKMVNSLKFTLSYDEALRLSDELIRSMDEGVAFYARYGREMVFARSFFMFLMRRYLLIAHRPFGLSVWQSPKFTYSRKLCLESSMEILSLLQAESQLEADHSYGHLGQLGGGMFRYEFFHAAITVCVELRLQIEEVSPASHRSALTDLVQSQQTVMLQAVESTIEALESQISAAGKGCKAFIFLSLVYASVKANLNGEDALKAVGQVSNRVVAHCKELMNEVPWEELQDNKVCLYGCFCSAYALC